MSAAAGELADEHQGVVPSVSVANLVAQRAGILERFAQIFALLDETQALARNAQLAHPRVCIDQSWQLRGGVAATIVGGRTAYINKGVGNLLQFPPLT